MVDDQLSEVFDLVEVRGVLSGAVAVRGPWVSRVAVEIPLKFVALARGRATLTVDGVSEPIELAPGDVAILSNRSRLELSGGSGGGPAREIVPDEVELDRVVGAGPGTDVILGGRIDLNQTGRALLLQALPPVAHVRAAAAGATNLRASLERLFDEATGGRIGSAFAVRQYGQLLLLDVLRAYVDQVELPPGWLRLLTDDRLRPALTAMHADPARSWSLPELSRLAAMSRTSFAERFRTVAAMPPLTYLARWRMLLAQRALRDGDSGVRALAIELGYGSESAFSTAFKREVGVSPLRYRRQARAGTAGTPQLH
jgi:AraC-like DNA-binding protein